MLFKSYQIENNINNLRTNLNLFYGENVGLKDEFKNKIEEDSAGSEVIRLNEEETLPLMGYNSTSAKSLNKYASASFENLK